MTVELLMKQLEALAEQVADLAADKAATKKAETKKAETKKAETKKAETKKAETKKAETPPTPDTVVPASSSPEYPGVMVSPNYHDWRRLEVVGVAKRATRGTVYALLPAPVGAPVWIRIPAGMTARQYAEACGLGVHPLLAEHATASAWLDVD